MAHHQRFKSSSVVDRTTRISSAIKKLSKLPRHRIAEAVLRLDGKPLDLSEYKLFYPLYDLDSYKMIYKTGRQVAKTTSLSGRQVLSASFRPYFKTMYASPLEKQAHKYSSLNVKPFLKSPFIKKCFVDYSTTNSITMRELRNGSVMHFCYIQNGADRVRGLSADEICWDEIQNILYDHIPVVEQCMSASEYGRNIFCGTPLTLENTMESLWGQSSQCEWVMPCSHCNHDIMVIEPQCWLMITPKGPVCDKCGGLIEDVTNGYWLPKNPSMVGIFDGYHIPQIVVKKNLTKKRWYDIYTQFLTYGKARFANEVLGLSYDLGGRPITLTELKRLAILEPQRFDKDKYSIIVAGIDWGVSNLTSFTTVVIMGFRAVDGVPEIIYSHKYQESEIMRQIDHMVEKFNKYGVAFAAADVGVGNMNNQELKKKWKHINTDQVIGYNYVQAVYFNLKWDDKSEKYILNRTTSLNQLFFDMKQGKMLFPKEYADTTKNDVFNHVLSVYEELIDTPSGKKKRYRHSASKPDDFCHSLISLILPAEEPSVRS